MTLIYAKKLRLPSERANVLQSLNMALAFSQISEKKVRFFPGMRDGACREGQPTADLAQMLRGLGAETFPQGWKILPGASGAPYGLRFRLNVLKAALAEKAATFYARDISEALFLSSLRMLTPRPFFYEAHETLHLMHKDDGKASWRSTWRKERRVLAHVTGLVVTNDLLAEEAGRIFGYRGPILVAPNGFNPVHFHSLPLFDQTQPWPSPCQSPGQSEEQPVVAVYVGNFYPGKGVDTLLEALHALPERFRLRLIGGRPEEELARLRAQAKELSIAHRVEFLGSVPQASVREACMGAHMFIIPQQSAFFPSPLKLYEALALGLPVIVTPLSCFGGQITDGLVFPASDGSAAGLASAMAALAKTPETAAALREKGLLASRDQTWQARARRILNFMETVRANTTRRAWA